MFVLISAVGKNREIGKNNGLIFRIKDDLQFFRDITRGHKVVMGRKTWESLPNKLKNRENIVISSHNFDGPDQIIHNLDNFITENKDSTEEIFIIGGSMIYEALLPYAQTLYLTEIDASDPSATTFFPNFDKTNYTANRLKQGECDNLTYSIIKYTKNN